MARSKVTIPIHGPLLRDMIKNHGSIESVSSELKVSRQSVHTWFSTGRIAPRRLSDLVKLLNLSAEDVKLLSRASELREEKMAREIIQMKKALIQIREQADTILNRFSSGESGEG